MFLFDLIVIYFFDVIGEDHEKKRFLIFDFDILSHNLFSHWPGTTFTSVAGPCMMEPVLSDHPSQ